PTRPLRWTCRTPLRAAERRIVPDTSLLVQQTNLHLRISARHRQVSRLRAGGGDERARIEVDLKPHAPGRHAYARLLQRGHVYRGGELLFHAYRAAAAVHIAGGLEQFFLRYHFD